MEYTEKDYAELIQSKTDNKPKFIPVWREDRYGTFTVASLSIDDDDNLLVSDSPDTFRRQYYVGCQQCYDALKRRLNGLAWGGPAHTYSDFCRSGKRPHCTCDTCF